MWSLYSNAVMKSVFYVNVSHMPGLCHLDTGGGEIIVDAF